MTNITNEICFENFFTLVRNSQRSQIPIEMTGLCPWETVNVASTQSKENNVFYLYIYVYILFDSITFHEEYFVYNK